MQIEDWKSTRKLSPLYRELAEMELLENIAELEAFGFTVVPPEKVGPDAMYITHPRSVGVTIGYVF